jgi:hypothetical protein
MPAGTLTFVTKVAYAQSRQTRHAGLTGYTCVNCRKMENVWTEDRINRYLTDEYVIVSLYTDDHELPRRRTRVDRLDSRPYQTDRPGR